MRECVASAHVWLWRTIKIKSLTSYNGTHAIFVWNECDKKTPWHERNFRSEKNGIWIRATDNRSALIRISFRHWRLYGFVRRILAKKVAPNRYESMHSTAYHKNGDMPNKFSCCVGLSRGKKYRWDLFVCWIRCGCACMCAESKYICIN